MAELTSLEQRKALLDAIDLIAPNTELTREQCSKHGLATYTQQPDEISFILSNLALEPAPADSDAADEVSEELQPAEQPEELRKSRSARRRARRAARRGLPEVAQAEAPAMQPMESGRTDMDTPVTSEQVSSTQAQHVHNRDTASDASPFPATSNSPEAMYMEVAPAAANTSSSLLPNTLAQESISRQITAAIQANLERLFYEDHDSLSEYQLSLPVNWQFRCSDPVCGRINYTHAEHLEHSKFHRGHLQHFRCTFPDCYLTFVHDTPAWEHTRWHAETSSPSLGQLVPLQAACPTCDAILPASEFVHHQLLQHHAWVMTAFVRPNDIVWIFDGVVYRMGTVSDARVAEIDPSRGANRQSAVVHGDAHAHRRGGGRGQMRGRGRGSRGGPGSRGWREPPAPMERTRDSGWAGRRR